MRWVASPPRRAASVPFSALRSVRSLTGQGSTEAAGDLGGLAEGVTGAGATDSADSVGEGTTTGAGAWLGVSWLGGGASALGRPEPQADRASAAPATRPILNTMFMADPFKRGSAPGKSGADGAVEDKGVAHAPRPRVQGDPFAFRQLVAEEDASRADRRHRLGGRVPAVADDVAHPGRSADVGPTEVSPGQGGEQRLRADRTAGLRRWLAGAGAAIARRRLGRRRRGTRGQARRSRRRRPGDRSAAVRPIRAGQRYRHGH